MDDDVITQLQLDVGNSGDVKKPELASNHKLHKSSMGITYRCNYILGEENESAKLHLQYQNMTFT